MKLFKKVMSLIIASIMMLQVAAFAAPAPADVNGTFYEDAAKLLSALEIMVGDGNSFNGDKNITRAEFTKIMVAAAGHANIVAGYKAKGIFTDVPTTEWYAPYVEFGKDMGAINGMGDGIFAPNEKVTGEQAVKMMVCIIGYGLQAAEIGYPEGYVNVARDLGALKGITNVDLTAPMTRGQAAVLCANILKIDVMKKVSSGDNEEWITRDGVTLLSDKFDAYEVEGVVSANASTAIWENSNLKAGEVEITVDGVRKTYLVGETDIDTKLGSCVEFVYQYDDDTEEATVLSYVASDKKNAAVTVKLDDLDLAASTNTLVKYWPSEDAKKVEELKVENMPAIIYNGVATASSDDLMTFLNSKIDLVGEVTFLDADKTEGAETIIVTAFETFVVEFIDTDDYIILDEIGEYKGAANGAAKSIQIDLDSKDVTATFEDKNGNEISFDALQEGDVLSVARSDGSGKKVFRVIVCDDAVSGVVKSFGENEFGKFYVELDDGKQYVYGDAMRAYVAKKGAGLKLGNENTFKLDAFGQVAAVEASEGSATGEFGFIIKSVESQSTAGSIQMKVFTADGEYKVFPLAGKVTIDGDKKSGDAEIKPALDAAIAGSVALVDGGYAGAAQVAPMLYEVNANGEIDYIDTPVVGTNEDAYTLGKIKGGSAGATSLTYSQYYKGFNNKIPFNSSAKILAIPADGDFSNDKKVYFMKQGDFEDQAYKIQLFNTDRDAYSYTFGICITTSAGSSSDAFRTGVDGSAQRKRPLFVVSKTTVALVEDEYGEDLITLKVYGMEEGSSKNITIDPDYYANGAYDANQNNARDTGENTLLDHIYYGVTFTETGTGNGTVNFAYTSAMSETRKSGVVLPGDVFTYGTNAEGYVHYVRAIFLKHEKAFLSQNYIEASGRVLGAIDFAIPVEINGKDARFAKISNPNDNFNEFMLEYDAASGTITKDIDGNSITSSVVVGDVTKTLYDAEKLTVNDVRSIGSAKIMVFDAKATNVNQMITSGSVADIIDTRNPIKAATPCIIRNFNSGIVAIVVFKNL